MFPAVGFIRELSQTVPRGSFSPMQIPPLLPSRIPTIFPTPVRTLLPSHMGTLLPTLFPTPLGTLLGTPLQTPINQLCSFLSPALFPKCPKFRTPLPPPLPPHSQPHFILSSILEIIAYLCYLSKTELIDIYPHSISKTRPSSQPAMSQLISAMIRFTTRKASVKPWLTVK